ncbi:nudix hydrolase 1 [Physcia stellaris]|nr:nudix hydrolase 1 [Physcia stellaris]
MLRPTSVVGMPTEFVLPAILPPPFPTSDSPKTNIPQQPTCTGTDFPAPWKSMNEYCTMEFGVTCGIVLTFSASSGSGNPGNCGNACSCSECPADEIECNAQECNAHPAYVGEAPADSKFGTFGDHHQTLFIWGQHRGRSRGGVANVR